MNIMPNQTGVKKCSPARSELQILTILRGVSKTIHSIKLREIMYDQDQLFCNVSPDMSDRIIESIIQLDIDESDDDIVGALSRIQL